MGFPTQKHCTCRKSLRRFHVMHLFPRWSWCISIIINYGLSPVSSSSKSPTVWVVVVWQCPSLPPFIQTALARLMFIKSSSLFSADNTLAFRNFPPCFSKNTLPCPSSHLAYSFSRPLLDACTCQTLCSVYISASQCSIWSSERRQKADGTCWEKVLCWVIKRGGALQNSGQWAGQ